MNDKQIDALGHYLAVLYRKLLSEGVPMPVVVSMIGVAVSHAFGTSMSDVKMQFDHIIRAMKKGGIDDC